MDENLLIMKRMMYLITTLLKVSAGCNQTAEKYYNAGVMMFSLQEYDEAIADFTKAIEINLVYSDLKTVSTYRPRILEKMGMKKNADLYRHSH